MFLRLGVLNVRRQLARSLLVIVTLALAAISLTYSLSYQHITPPVVASFLGGFAGGEILVAPIRWAGQQVTDVTGESNYRYTRLVASGMSWLEWFYPELYTQGFWARAGESPNEFFQQSDLQGLKQFPGIAEVVVTPMLPAVIHAPGGEGPADFPVRLAPSSSRLSQFACEAYLGDLPENLVGLLVNERMDLPKGVYQYQPDSLVQLWLPQVDASTNPRVNYAGAAAIELPFGGYLQLPTRTAAWWGPGEEIWAMAPSLQSEVGKFRGNIAWLDQSTWSGLLRQAGVADQLPVANLALRLDDPQQLDEIIVRLGQAFPDLTFVNMGSVEDRLFSTGSLEYFRRAPKESYSIADQTELVVPASFNRILGLLFILIAGFLLGGHVLTNAAARHQEIGTLRALGARRRDILLLGISEVGTLVFIGVTSGFLAIRLFGAIMELRGGQPLLTVLLRMLSEYGQVLGVALAASIIFAFFPIWRLASLSPMEVLRHE